MVSRRNSRYHIVMFVCSRCIIIVCSSIRVTSLYRGDEDDYTCISTKADQVVKKYTSTCLMFTQYPLSFRMCQLV